MGHLQSAAKELNSTIYLGVTLTKDLEWSEHISDITGNANKVLGLVKRNFWNSSRNVKETLYKSSVRPKLEYASEIWDPYYKKDTYAVEMIQRKAARFCMNNYRRESSVTELIETRGWDSLQLRRKQARLSLMCKLSNNLIDINLELGATKNKSSEWQGDGLEPGTPDDKSSTLTTRPCRLLIFLTDRTQP